jgi:hypothetical protein
MLQSYYIIMGLQTESAKKMRIGFDFSI